MAPGTVQTIVICVPSGFPQAPCPTGQAVSTVQAYVIDAAQGANIEAQFAPFDYAIASGIFGMAFSFVVGLYLVSKSAGVILQRIRR